jgi:hypothetical protein
MVAPKSADATPSGNKRGWDATAHEALLLCVIDEIKGGKVFLTEVTKRMQARGYTYSYDAIKYTHFFPTNSHFCSAIFKSLSVLTLHVFL